MSLALVLLNIKYLNIRLVRVLKYFTLIFQKYFTYDNASQPCLYHSLSSGPKSLYFLGLYRCPEQFKTYYADM